jgi:DNA-directed RNA polymerase I, II, and III subunit RPABC5
MIFPIRCISCNSVIAGKWAPYLGLVKDYRKKEGKSENAEMEYLTATTVKTAEGKALDDLGVKRMCCRRHFLSHVDLI